MFCNCLKTINANCMYLKKLNTNTIYFNYTNP